MAISVKHAFNSAKADGTDSTLVQPSNWNAQHTITLAAGKVLGRDSSGAGVMQELPLSFSTAGHATFANNLTVSGTSTFTGNATLSGTLGVTGAATFVNATLSGTLGVTGAATFVNATLSGTLGVTGASTLTGNVNIGTSGVAAKLYVSGNSASNIYALTDGATITPNFSTGNNFSVTLAGNRTLANPSNMTVGQSGIIYISQDATGSRTLAYGSYWKFPGATAPTLTTTASATDALVYTVRTSTSITVTSALNIG